MARVTSTLLTITAVFNAGLTMSTTALPEPTPMPTRRPAETVEHAKWSQTPPAPTDAPNAVRRLQMWTCCKPEPTEPETTHVNSKLTWSPTEWPTAQPTSAPPASDFCGNGLVGCRYYANECESPCECLWESNMETCAPCSLGEATVCLSCLPGWTLSGGACEQSDAFTEGEEDQNDNGISDDFWMGTGVGFVFCSMVVVCVGLMAFWWRSTKAIVSVGHGDHDDLKLTDDQQLKVVDTTTIQLNESVDVYETKPIEMEE